MNTILFLAANPADWESLALNHEARAIDEALQRAAHRDRFKLEKHGSVRGGDLQELLDRYRPTIVHFSGHGNSSEIMLEDDSGHSHPITRDALRKLFEIYRHTVRLVVLNACYSEPQAQAIAAFIPCVVGMSNAIGNDAATAFAAAFYQALANNDDVATAFKHGNLRIELERLRQEDTPKLVCPNVDPTTIRFVNLGAGAQDIYAADIERAEAVLDDILDALRDPAVDFDTEFDTRFHERVHVLKSQTHGRLLLRQRDVDSLGDISGQLVPEQRQAVYLIRNIILNKDYLYWHENYVPLRGKLQDKQQPSPPLRFRDPENPGISAHGAIIQDVRDALEYSENKDRLRLVIVGAPGAGKTVTLDRLAFDLALRCARDPRREKFPVRIDLVNFDRADHSVSAFLEAQWQNLDLTESYREAIRRGHVCFLLDGVNEMPFDDRRARVERWARWVQSELPAGNWAVFTSRFDYAGDLNLPQVIVQELDRERMEKFLTQRLGEKRAPKVWEEFQRRLRGEDDRFEKLAQNPLFLSLLAARVEQDKNFEQGRELVVNRAVLLGDLAQGRLDHEFSGGRRVPTEWFRRQDEITRVILNALSQIAFVQRSQGKAKTFTTSDAEQALQGQSLPIPAQEIVGFAERCNLIEREPTKGREPTYKYWHHLLHEYFAGNELITRFRAGQALAEKWRGLWRAEEYDAETAVTGWEESVIMAASLADDDAAQFVNAVRSDNLPSGGNLPLAGRALAEARAGRADLDELARELRDELRDRMRNPDAHIHARIQAGLALGELGHPEFSAQEFPFVAQEFPFDERTVWAIVPPLEPVPAGEFIFGSAPGDEDAYPSEITTERTIPLPAFEIGRYPVTNAEFQYFIKDDGYDTPRWWREEGWAWRQGGPDAHAAAIQDYLKTRDIYRNAGMERVIEAWGWDAERDSATIAYWKEMIEMDDEAATRRAAQIFERPFDRPGYWEDPEKNNPAQPVVGVNWYEAEAYCNWLAAVTGRAFRLAHEQEWEKAARGTEGFIYPWGNIFDRACCNSREGQIRNTTPVGIFADGISPFHGYDFSGNVWEWTKDWYRAYPGSDATSDEFGKIYRVVRGGSFYNARRELRCGRRGWDTPGVWDYNNGFRVVSPGS